MDVIQEFYIDKDEPKFLAGCMEAGIPCKILQQTEKRIIYRVGPNARPIADVYYFYQLKDVSIQWFKWNY